MNLRDFSSLQAMNDRTEPYSTRPGEIVGGRVVTARGLSSPGEEATTLAITLNRAAELDGQIEGFEDSPLWPKMGADFDAWARRWADYYGTGTPQHPFGREAAAAMPGLPGAADRQAALAAKVAAATAEWEAWQEHAGKLATSSGSPAWMPVAALLGLGALALFVAGRK